MRELYDVNKDMCPLCKMHNGCQNEPNCWCHNVIVPQALLERVPKEKREKVCICYFCIEKYKKEIKGERNDI